MEAATPGRPLPSKQELLDFQSRWLRPAGISALAAAFVTVGGVVAQHAGLNFPSGDSDADQLAFVHAHASRLILAAVVQAVGIGLFAVPLSFLFKAASDRAARVRRQLIYVVVMGPTLLGIALIVVSLGGKNVSDKFAAQAPAAEQRARVQAEQERSTSPADGTSGGASHSDQTTTAGTTTTGSTAQAKPRTPEEAANDARERVADDVKNDSTAASIAGLVQLVGVLSVLFAFVYTPLWALRTGLLSRPFGYFGILAGFLFIAPLLGPLSGLAVVIWLAVLGLMFLGVWRLPPAWAAGEAIPWLRPGEELGPPTEERGPGGTVEGSGREVSEQPLAENGAEAEPTETQGQRRKKRKRRK